MNKNTNKKGTIKKKVFFRRSALSTHQSYILDTQIIHTQHQECFSLALASQSLFDRRKGQVKVR